MVSRAERLRLQLILEEKELGEEIIILEEKLRNISET